MTKMKIKEKKIVYILKFFSLKKQPPVVFFKKRFLKSSQKNTYVLFLIKLKTWRLHEKSDSDSSVLQLILWNFWELHWATAAVYERN